MIALALTGVSKTYRASYGEVAALRDLTLQVDDGEFLVVVGSNGSGKSTLLDIIAGAALPDAGVITARIDGKERNWTCPGSGERQRVIARVYQNPVRGSATGLTVGENLRLAEMAPMPSPLLPALGARRRRSLLAGLAPGPLHERFDALADDLSGGHLQLLALEMAVARKAGLILLDEPTASLDRRNAAECLARVETLRRRSRATVILVTHDLNAACEMGDRLVVLSNGGVAADLSGEAKARLVPAALYRLIESNV